MPMKGFPASELPRYLATNSLHGTLLPFDDRAVSQQIIYEAGKNTPDGPKLVANIAGNIYQFWKDTANLRIRWTYETRKQPFYDYKWVVTPRLDEAMSLVLNPEKAGIVSCRIMAGVIEQPSWAGHIKAVVWDSNETTPYAMEVGEIDINNLPEQASAAPAAINSTEATVTARSQPPLEDQLSARALTLIPANVQRPWLQCFSILYWIILSKPFAGKVGSDPEFPTPTPPRDFTTFRFPCGAPKREVHLLLSPDAAPTAQTALTWDFLATEMLEWIAQVALGERRFDETWLIKNRETLVGMIAIALGPVDVVSAVANGTTTTA
ncbi:MAG: hypothetical protein Q9202_003618 [Teloschistes flavicans]